jgi:hypothetical protein
MSHDIAFGRGLFQPQRVLAVLLAGRVVFLPVEQAGVQLTEFRFDAGEFLRLTAVRVLAGLQRLPGIDQALFKFSRRRYAS